MCPKLAHKHGMGERAPACYRRSAAREIPRAAADAFHGGDSAWR